MFELKAKFDADLLLYSLSHFECDGHTVHLLAQQCLLPPLTTTVKSSLFTCTPAHSPWRPGYIDVVRTVLNWLDFFWTDLVYVTKPKICKCIKQKVKDSASLLISLP